MTGPEPPTAPRWGRIGAFYGLSCLGAILCGLVLWGLKGQPLAPVFVGVTMMGTPTVAAILVLKLHGEPLLGPLGLRLGRWPYLVLGLLLPILLYGLMVGWGLVLPGVEWSPSIDALLARSAPGLPPEALSQAKAQLDALPVHPAVLAFLVILPAGLFNAIPALGEELGWRGFLHHELRSLGPWQESLITGTLWGFWHAPIILQGHNFPAHPVPGVFVMVAGTIAFSPFFTFLRRRSGSVLSSALLHGAFNAGTGVLISLFEGPDLVLSPLGLVGILAMLVLWIPLALLFRKEP